MITIYNNKIGVLYKNGNFVEIIKSGNHEYLSSIWGVKYKVLIFDATHHIVANNYHTALTKDGLNITLSFTFEYSITDHQLICSFININDGGLTQDGSASLNIYLKQIISDYYSSFLSAHTIEEIVEKRELLSFDEKTLLSNLKIEGISAFETKVTNISLPKGIADAYTKKAEARIKSSTELENARTTIATQRALKNVSVMLKEDPELYKVMQFELLKNIANAKNKNIFNVYLDENKK